MHSAVLRRLSQVAVGLALAALAASASPAAAHNGAIVYSGTWADRGCYDFPEDDMTICQDISGRVHITVSPSGVLSFSDRTGGHFAITVNGTVIQDEDFDSHAHGLILRGDAQQQTIVYLFDGTYYGLACDGRWVYTISGGELRFEHYVNDCEDEAA
jgi:hypothetical protein